MKIYTSTTTLLLTLLISKEFDAARLFGGRGKTYGLSVFDENIEMSEQESSAYNKPFAPPMVAEKKGRPFNEMIKSNFTRSAASPTASPRSSFGSNTTTPRQSLRKFVRDSWGSLTSVADFKNHSRSNSFEDETPDARHASSVRPQSLTCILNFEGEPAIQWDSLVTPDPLDPIRMDKIKMYSEKLGYYEDERFTDSVLKTLEYIGRSGFVANNLTINLAIDFVDKYKDKAPKALKLFLQSRFRPMFGSEAPREAIFLEAIMDRLPKHARELVASGALNEEILSFFFNLTHRSKDSSYSRQFDSMVFLYMQAFNHVSDIGDFIDIYAKIIQVLLSIKPNDTAAEIKSTIIFEEGFNEFEEKVNEALHLNDFGNE